MDILVGDFYVRNTLIYPSEEIKNQFDASSYKFYEVFRVMDRKAIFLKDHTQRLKTALRAMGYAKTELDHEIAENLSGLIAANETSEGNIKLLCLPGDKFCDWVAYYIPHSYPREEDYRIGVNLVSQQIERPEPNLKQVSVSDRIRHHLNMLAGGRNIYEILLIDKNRLITEGSRSNFFLIKQGVLYTAPDDRVLKGITRLYVLKIAREKGIRTIFETIPLEELAQFDAAFICGTSPKILPVRKIDEYTFNAGDETIRILSEGYDQSIRQYLQSVK